MILLDSSVIIALFRSQERFHPEAKSIIKNEESFLLLDFVLSEVLTVIKMREGFEIASQCQKFLLNFDKIQFLYTAPEDFEDAQHFFSTHKNKLSFVDTLLIVLARKKNLILATFDQDLGKTYKSFVKK